MLVVYNFDSNNILVEPLNNREAGKRKTAWSLINNTLSNGVVIPKLYVLDNEVSLELNASMKKKQIRYQLFPPTTHHRNDDERDIKTHRNNFYLV